MVDYLLRGLANENATKPTTHPGEILREEFLKPYRITTTELSEKIALSVEQINAVINAEQSLSTDMALCLSQLFGTSPELWLNGQMKWDIAFPD
ncbi:MAG TPA: addiction module antidote protein, HigA family [Thiotrichaceae bacterium]|nr:addiction module antidote protein, HigA family [Thiotrichaceae bacterium]